MDYNLFLEMPVFHPEYKRWIKYGYENSKEKRNLNKVLTECSRGYCMYCYSRVLVDEKMFGNLEHAIEKANSNKLINCIPNIGLSCSICNQTFKKIGEQKRRLPEEKVIEFENNSKCSEEKRKQCTVPCKALKELQLHYNALPEGQIILQPVGVRGKNSGEPLTLQYDILNMQFQAAAHFHQYSEDEREFIALHIKRFRLNDPKFRTKRFYEFIKNVIDNDGKLPEYEFNNMIVELFYEKLKGKSEAEILKICKGIYSIIFLKM